MPAAYTATQKAAISQFTNITQADNKTAARVLRSHNWNLEVAVNEHLEHGGPPQNAPLRAGLGKLFDKYRDNKAEPDLVGPEGTMKYFQDIGVDLEGVDVLIASELLKCEILGELKRQNFIDGWASTNADTIPKQKSLLAARKQSLTTPTSRPLFHAIYKHTFTIARQSTSQKVVPLEFALTNWRTLFSSPSIEWRTESTPWLDYWCDFLEARWKKSVNRDMWEQTYQFFEQTMQDESMDWYSEEGAWPSVIDEFVTFVREEKRGGEGQAGEMDVE